MAATNTAAMNAFMFFAPITSEYLSSTERRYPAEQDPPSSNSAPYLDRGAWQPYPSGKRQRKVFGTLAANAGRMLIPLLGGSGTTLRWGWLSHAAFGNL